MINKMTKLNALQMARVKKNGQAVTKKQVKKRRLVTKSP